MDPTYMLGGLCQKEIIRKERIAGRESSKMKKLQEKADKRPVQDRVPHGLKAENFTVESVKGRSFFSGII